mmetsp:Transcript_31006/g.68649  ORF Transcript_31006/g.68649 Transcript_31006/m.68649 type:complete len:239 (-) Transcript_31006:92-808(-)
MLESSGSAYDNVLDIPSSRIRRAARPTVNARSVADRMVRTRNLTLTVTRYGSGTCCEDAFSPGPGPAAAMCSPFDRAMTFYLLPISPPFFLLFILFLTGCLNMLILVLYDGLDCSRGLGIPLCVSRLCNPFALPSTRHVLCLCCSIRPRTESESTGFLSTEIIMNARGEERSVALYRYRQATFPSRYGRLGRKRWGNFIMSVPPSAGLDIRCIEALGLDCLDVVLEGWHSYIPRASTS